MAFDLEVGEHQSNPGALGALNLVDQRRFTRPIAITLDRYGHLLPGAGDEAAELLDEYLDRWRAEKARNATLSEASAPMDVPAELAA